MLQELTDADVERLTAQGLGEIGLDAVLRERAQRARAGIPHAMGRVDALLLASDSVPETLRRFTAGNEASGRYVEVFEKVRASTRERLLADHPEMAEEVLTHLSTAAALTAVAAQVIDQTKTLLVGALNAAINDVKEMRGEAVLVEAQAERLHQIIIRTQVQRVESALQSRDGAAPPP